MSRLLVATTRCVESFCQRPELPSSSSPLPPPPHPDIPRLWLPNVDFSQSSETPRRPDGISEPQAPGESSVIVARRVVWSGQYPYVLLLSNSHHHFTHNPVPGSPSLKSQPSVRSQASENPEPRVDLMRVFIRDPPKKKPGINTVSPRSHHASSGSVPEVSRSRERCSITNYYSPRLADQAPTEAIVPSPGPRACRADR
jgi:hypothetical protein